MRVMPTNPETIKKLMEILKQQKALLKAGKLREAAHLNDTMREIATEQQIRVGRSIVSSLEEKKP